MPAAGFVTMWAPIQQKIIHNFQINENQLHKRGI